MIFRIRLPRIEDLLRSLEEDGSSRSDIKRQTKLPKKYECSCLCSVWDMTTTWNFILTPMP